MRTVKEIKEDIAKGIQHTDDRRVMDMYRAEITSGIQIDRLEEICNAEREGRCMVLPCKVGDTVYSFCDTFHQIFAYFIEEINVGYYSEKEIALEFIANYSKNYELIDSIDFEISDIGKTVFLTREDAEKALKE